MEKNYSKWPYITQPINSDLFYYFLACSLCSSHHTSSLAFPQKTGYTLILGSLHLFPLPRNLLPPHIHVFVQRSASHSKAFPEHLYFKNSQLPTYQSSYIPQLFQLTYFLCCAFAPSSLQFKLKDRDFCLFSALLYLQHLKHAWHLNECKQKSFQKHFILA